MYARINVLLKSRGVHPPRAITACSEVSFQAQPSSTESGVIRAYLLHEKKQLCPNDAETVAIGDKVQMVLMSFSSQHEHEKP